MPCFERFPRNFLEGKEKGKKKKKEKITIPKFLLSLGSTSIFNEIQFSKLLSNPSHAVFTTKSNN